MAIVYDTLLALDIPAVEHTYGPRDCMLYALGLGLGQDPMNEDELAFVYEKNLKVLPTFALVQGYTPYWLRNPQSGVTWNKVVHGEQGMTLHKPVASEGVVTGKTRIREVIDKGEGKGALVYSERKITDKQSGELLATLTQTTFCRADGGFGGPKDGTKREAPKPHALPERAPDVTCDLLTRPEMAPGCPDHFDLEFLRYIWHFRDNPRRRIIDVLEHFPHLRVVRVRNGRERTQFLASL